MSIVKRSSLALMSVVFMLGVAGYINYKYNPEREQNLGQTVYVNGKDSFTYDNVSIYSDEEEKDEEKEISENIESDDSIAVFKYDRDNMYSELSENYMAVINNENTDKEKINEYQEKLNTLIKEKNLINMVENVIKSKGIEDIVIIPTSNGNLNVVIKSDTQLEQNMIAQIQQILVDQLGVSADKISISVREK